MAILDKSKRLRKELSLFGVYAIATGTTLSAGFFVLPGLAVEQAGPAMILSYLIAAALLVPAMLSIVELATAMPRAGGAYYFLDRSLGPLAGTIGGVGTWLALTLKTAFALVGMGAYVRLFFPEAPMTLVAVVFALFFGFLNILGAGKTARFQIVLVFALLTILVWFIVAGSVKIDVAHFEGFFDEGGAAILSTAGLVFISYVGVTKVASVSEEVRDPERNLPLGIFLALGTAVLIYALGILVMVGVLPSDGLAGNLTPVAAVADTIAGRVGVAMVSVAAILAFSSVANGGILSSSRYPLAMARDHLLPRFLRALSPRRTPVRSIMLTVIVVLLYIIFLDPLGIAKLASAFQLLMFALLCLAVIVMRESGLESYDPGYRSPLYPWLHIVGFAAPFYIIAQMGWLPAAVSVGLIAVGMVWYFYYVRGRVERHGAIYRVFDRLGHRESDELDRELRGIMKEKGLRADDPFDEMIIGAAVIEADPEESFDCIVERASERLAQQMRCSAEMLIEGFMEGTRTGATPVTGGVALPHMRVPGIDRSHMVIVRSLGGVSIAIGDAFGTTKETGHTHAIFFLVSPDSDPGQHLRMLAELASRMDEEDFLDRWRAEADRHRLKEVLLRHDQFLTLRLSPGSPSEELIDTRISEIDLPDGCLVAVIRREARVLVPRGDTVLRARDRLSIIGSERAIATLFERYSADVGSADEG